MVSTALFPTWPMPQTVAQRQQAQPSVAYPRSYAFDFEAGDFLVDGAGRVPTLDGHRTWAQWVLKTVLTQRFAHLVYSARYGLDLARVLGQPQPAVATAEFQREVTEALLTDRRTRAVSNVTVTRRGDEATATFTAMPTVGAPDTIEVTLRG
ncbi:MAG: DUF2634 domain-containing protein [Chloroflexota bacterium]